MLSDVKKTENEMNKKIINLNEILQNKTNEYDAKFTKIFDKMDEFSSLIALRKHDNENIEQLLGMKNKIDDQILEIKAKLNVMSKSLDKSINRYDQAISENLLVPGIIGIGCKFNNCRNFFEYVCKEFKAMQEYKDQQNLTVKQFQNNNENLISLVQKNIDKMGEKCKEHYHLKTIQYEQKIDNKIRNIEDKVLEMKSEHLKYTADLLSNMKNLDIQWNKLENIKSEIYGKFFHELIKFQEEVGNISKAFKDQESDYVNLKKRFTQISDFLKDFRYQRNASKSKPIREMSKKTNFAKKQNFENKISDEPIRFLSPKKQIEKENIVNNNNKNISQSKSPTFKNRKKESINYGKISVDKNDKKEPSESKTSLKNINSSVNRLKTRNSVENTSIKNSLSINTDVKKSVKNIVKKKEKLGKRRLESKLVTENNLVLNFNTKNKKPNIKNLLPESESESDYSLGSSISMSISINKDDNKEGSSKKNEMRIIKIKEIPNENDNEQNTEKAKQVSVKGKEKIRDCKNNEENENNKGKIIDTIIKEKRSQKTKEVNKKKIKETIKENTNEPNKEKEKEEIIAKEGSREPNKEKINETIKENTKDQNKEKVNEKVKENNKENNKEKINEVNKENNKENNKELNKEKVNEIIKENNKEPNKEKINEVNKEKTKDQNKEKVNEAVDEINKELNKEKVNESVKENNKESNKEKVNEIIKEKTKEQNKEKENEIVKENNKESNKEKINEKIIENINEDIYMKSESDKYISEKKHNSFKEKNNLSAERKSNNQSKQNLISRYPILSDYNSTQTDRKNQTERTQIINTKLINEIKVPKININSEMTSNSTNALSKKAEKIRIKEKIFLSPELTDNTLNDCGIKIESKTDNKTSRNDEEDTKYQKNENVESKKYIKNDILEKIKNEKNNGITFLTTINNSNNNVNNNDTIYLIKENNKSINNRIKILEEKTESVLKQVNMMHKILSSIHYHLKNKKHTIRLDNKKSISNKGTIEQIKYNSTNYRTSRISEIKSGLINRKLNGIGALFNIDNEFNEFNINLNGNENTSHVLKKLEPFLIKQFSKNIK